MVSTPRNWGNTLAAVNGRGKGGTVSNYQVEFFSGDYWARQLAANRAGAICYVEQHFNWAIGGDGVEVVLARNASRSSKNLGEDVTQD